MSKYAKIEAVLDARPEQWGREYRFHPKRKWRFDYACPTSKLAIEIQGGVFVHGRHSGGVGQVKDMEKFNAAAALGWRVGQFMPSQHRELAEWLHEIVK